MLIGLERDMFESGKRLTKKRNDIIMACLSGGQHIDAALEAAERLVPTEELNAAYKKDDELYEAYLDNLRKAQEERAKSCENRTSTTNSFAHYLSRWFSF